MSVGPDRPGGHGQGRQFRPGPGRPESGSGFGSKCYKHCRVVLNTIQYNANTLVGPDRPGRPGQVRPFRQGPRRPEFGSGFRG